MNEWNLPVLVESFLKSRRFRTEFSTFFANPTNRFQVHITHFGCICVFSLLVGLCYCYCWCYIKQEISLWSSHPYHSCERERSCTYPVNEWMNEWLNDQVEKSSSWFMQMWFRYFFINLNFDCFILVYNDSAPHSKFI